MLVGLAEGTCSLVNLDSYSVHFVVVVLASFGCSLWSVYLPYLCVKCDCSYDWQNAVMCRNMLGAGAASNPSSRNSSRDNSRSRDMPPTPSKVSSGPDASQMNSEELERRLTTIAEELHSNQNIKVCCVHYHGLRGANPSWMAFFSAAKLMLFFLSFSKFILVRFVE